MYLAASASEGRDLQSHCKVPAAEGRIDGSIVKNFCVEQEISQSLVFILLPNLLRTPSKPKIIQKTNKMENTN